MMHQQDMADSLWWFALWGPCIDPWINMVSIQICQIFLRLLKIAFACNVCDVAFLHATNAMSHTLHTLHTLHAKKKPYVYDCPSSWKHTPEKRSRTESLPKVFLQDNYEQIYFILLFCLSHKKRNEKWDSSYTAICVSSWYIRTNSSRSIFWIQKIFCSMMQWLIYAGIQYGT